MAVPRRPRPRPGGPRPRLLVPTAIGPVPCLVVRHPRARRFTLRHGPEGLRLTVPARASGRQIETFLAAQSAWIAAAVGASAPPMPLRPGALLPLHEHALVLTERVADGPLRVAREGMRLVVSGTAPADLRPTVERWYRREARQRLTPWAEQRAAALGVRVAAVTIRDPRSRWGSCSAAGRLSLSWRLLLAPEAVARHVVDHEVCHLVHLDHSPAFWNLLRSVDPDTERARRWLAANGDLLRQTPFVSPPTEGDTAVTPS